MVLILTIVILGLNFLYYKEQSIAKRQMLALVKICLLGLHILVSLILVLLHKNETFQWLTMLATVGTQIYMFIKIGKRDQRTMRKTALQGQAKIAKVKAAVIAPVVTVATGGNVALGAVAQQAMSVEAKIWDHQADKIKDCDSTVFENLKGGAERLGINVKGEDVQSLAEKIISYSGDYAVKEAKQASPGIDAVQLATKLICQKS